MSKLIYSPSASRMEATYSRIRTADKTLNPVYYSVAFTGDGFMYTHGQKFRLFKIVDDAPQGLSFSVTNGTAGLYMDSTLIGSGSVIQSIQGDGIINEGTISNGVASISHAEFLTEQAGQYGSATQVPIITVNKSGHITSISNSGTIDVSYVQGSSTTTQGTYYPVGVTNSNSQKPKYQTSFYFDESGNVHATNFYIGNKALSALFAPLSHTSVEATGSVLGHVKLYDSADSTKDDTAGWAATPKAVDAAITAANQYAEDLFASQDAMIFVGTMNAAGVIQAHNSAVVNNVTDGTTNIITLDYKTGWTLRFTTAGQFQGENVEVGDMLIAVNNKGNDFSISDWTIIQANLDGTLSSTSNLTGVLYGTGSRNISALAFDNGKVLKSTTDGISFVNPNTLWRTIKVDNTSIGTHDLNLLSSTYITVSNTNGNVTISAKASDIIGTTQYLKIKKGQTEFQYKPNAESILNIGGGLDLSVSNSQYTLAHASGTAFTNKLGSITTDSYGHVTNITEVSSLANPYSLTIKDNTDSILTYSGSEAKTLKFANGTDISFTSSTSNNEVVLTPSITHKYRAISFYANSTSENATSLIETNATTTFTLVGGDNVTLSTTNLPAGTLKISAEDTWRNVLAYKVQSNTLTQLSLGSAALNFGSDFLYSNNELGIMWTEIDDQGNVEYVK